MTIVLAFMIIVVWVVLNNRTQHVAVHNTQQLSVHKLDLSIGSFSVCLVNGYFSNTPYENNPIIQEEITPVQAIDNTLFSSHIVQVTRAFSKTTHYSREFGFLPLDNYVIHLGCEAKTLSSEDMKSWAPEAHAVVKNIGNCPITCKGVLLYLKVCVLISGICTYSIMISKLFVNIYNLAFL